MPRLIRAALDASGVKDPERASSGIDVVGDIAIVRLADFGPKEKRKIAETLIGEMKNVRVVMEQKGGIEGEFRLRRLRHLAGERRTMTVHRENGCAFKVDVAKCYFSPRLSTERLRVARGVKEEENVLNMFAGVGPFSITIAKLAGAHVTSFEVNEFAAKLHLENNRLNRVEGLVDVHTGDARVIGLATQARFDRILMPLPERADTFLPMALALARKGAMVHYYRHLLGREEKEAAESLRRELDGLLPKGAKYQARRVREVGPRWVEMVADIHLAR